MEMKFDDIKNYGKSIFTDEDKNDLWEINRHDLQKVERVYPYIDLAEGEILKISDDKIMRIEITTLGYYYGLVFTRKT